MRLPLVCALAWAAFCACSGSGGKSVDAGPGPDDGGGAACSPLAERRGWATVPTDQPARIRDLRASATGRWVYAIGDWVNDGRERQQLIRSEDDGTTWCTLATPAPFGQVLPAPGDDRVLYGVVAMSAEGPRIFRSDDGGTVWVDADGDLPRSTSRRPPVLMAIARKDPRIAWVQLATDQRPSPRMLAGLAPPYITRTGGRIWKAEGAEVPRAAETTAEIVYPTFAVDPSRPDDLFAVDLDADYKIVLHRSRDAGGDWESLALDLPPLSKIALSQLGYSAPSLAIDADSTLYLPLERAVWTSSDGGKSWAAHALPTPRYPVMLVAPRPGLPGQLYARVVDVLLETRDGASTWRPLDLPAPPTAFPTFVPTRQRALAPTAAGIALVPDDGQTSLVVPLPHALSQLVAASATVLWASSPTQVSRSTDGGRSWVAPRALPTGARFASHPTDFSAAFALQVDSWGVYRTDDVGRSWQKIAMLPLPMSRDSDNGVLVVADQGRTVYAATSRSLVRSDDGGQTWQRRGGLDLAGTLLAIDPGDPDHLFRPAGGGDFDDGRGMSGPATFIDESRDGGRMWTRRPIWGNPRAVSDLVVVRSEAGRAVLASVGDELYRTTDDGLTWKASGRALVRLVASGPRIYAVDRSMRPAASAFRSDDGGATWSLIPAPTDPTNCSFAPTSSAPERLLFLCRPDMGAFPGGLLDRLTQ